MRHLAERATKRKSSQPRVIPFRDLSFSDLAPAMLTVGSMEYQLGRRDDAIALFRGLLKLPTDTPELEVIIDKARDYLLSEKDYERAAGR